MKDITYSQFHYKFLGYSFKSRQTGRIFSKGCVWDKFRIKAISMVETGSIDPYFQLVDSEGWVNGSLKKHYDCHKRLIDIQKHSGKMLVSSSE